MSDWLDSEEFEAWFCDLTTRMPLMAHVRLRRALRQKIREHFVPKWIKITDDPATWPPVGKEILVCDSVGFIRHDSRIQWKQIGDDCVSAFDNSAFYEQPVAWMPIPEPPPCDFWIADSADDSLRK